MGKEANRLYEASYFLSGACSEEEAFKEDEKIKAIVAKNQALILGEAKLRRQRLAYPVKKSAEGHFGWIRFSVAPEYLTKIKSELAQNNLIVRMLVKIFKNPPPEARIIKPKFQKTALAARKPEKTVTSRDMIRPETIKPEEIDKKLEEILGN